MRFGFTTPTHSRYAGENKLHIGRCPRTEGWQVAVFQHGHKLRILRYDVRIMRANPVMDALFPRVRQAILGTMLLDPDRSWYMNDLAHHLGVRPSSLQRELSRLAGAGILRTWREGNRVYYQPDPACPVLSDLRGMFLRTVELADILKKALQPFDQDFLDHIFLDARDARKLQHPVRVQWAFHQAVARL